MKDSKDKEPDITSREYLRRRIWSDAWVAGLVKGSLIEARRWSGLALEEYDREFGDKT